jgi:hypothetical protein
MFQVVTYLSVTLVSGFLTFNGKRLLGANRTKVLYSTMAGGWTILYAGIAPLAADSLGLNDPTIDNFYLFGSVMLLLGYVVFILVLKAMPIRDVDLDRASDVIIFAIVMSAVIVTFMFPESKLTQYLRTTALLPGVAVLYILAKNPSGWTKSVIAHTLLIAASLAGGLFSNSKEELVVAITGPMLIAYILRSRRINFRSAAIFFIIASVLFILVQPIVELNRSGQDLYVSELLPNFYERMDLIIRASVLRVNVLDALARTLANEFTVTPARPNAPVWALTGWVFSIVPAFFERPDHARQALRLTGYVTSNDEVNIALTYLGNLVWAFGVEIFPLSITLFWFITSVLISIGSRFRREISLLFQAGVGFIFFRLESTTYGFLGSIFVLFVFALLLQLLFQIMGKVRK